MRGWVLFLSIVLPALTLAGEPDQPPPAPESLPAPPGVPEPPPAPLDPRVVEGERILAQVKEARALIKAGRPAEAAVLLRQLALDAERAGLPADDRAYVYYQLGRALRKADQDEEAEVQIRRARDLQPGDIDTRLLLGRACNTNENWPAARAEAEAALRLGAKGEDADDAREILQKARDGVLHDRLYLVADLSYGYDSNILEGSQAQTIANHYTRGTTRQMTKVASGHAVSAVDFTSPTLYRNLVQTDYRTPSPSTSQWGLPLEAEIEIRGRVAGSRRLGFFLGYRFQQTVITYAESDPTGQLPDPDTYNFQEHDLLVGLTSQAWRWLDLNVRAEGVVNFSGLVQFTPYQYGFNAVLDATFIESPRWRTRLLYEHQLFKSFDEVNDGYLDGNIDQLTLYQELRTKWARPQLGYRLTNNTSGDLIVAPVPLQATLDKGITRDIGFYTYHAPLGYLGNRVFGKVKLLLPWDLKLTGALSYEYQLYANRYFAEYTSIIADSASFCPYDSAEPRKSKPCFEAGSDVRHDHQIEFGLALRKALPRAFAVELSYGFLDNISNIDNAIDNRNYTKHTVTALANYTF